MSVACAPARASFPARVRDPAVCGLGIVVPAAGFVVVVHYLSERGRLVRGDADRDADGGG
jgi:hypothetical protein